MPFGRRRELQASACWQCGDDGAGEGEALECFDHRSVPRALALVRSIMSYRKLEIKGYGLAYDGESRVLVRRSNDKVAFEISMDHNVLQVQTRVVIVLHGRRTTCSWRY